MCGINGFNWNDKQLIKAMNKCLDHRGPDKSKYALFENLSLGSTRLSIVDLSPNGDQPMSDKNNEIFIVHNGEVYNFLELKEQDSNLQKYDFKSTTDTEVLIYLYKEYGRKMLEKIDGMFAFCIYDSKKNELFLARDRFGEKPLYYYLSKEKFIFSSEIKAILKHEIPVKIDRESLKCYLTYGYSFDPKTFFYNIYQLPPSHAMVFDLKTKKITKYRYWSPSFKINENANFNQSKEKLLYLLDKSVKNRLISDVPLGAFLSGGIDSSSVVSYMAEYKDSFYTFSIGFDRQDFDESKYAKIVSDMYNTNHIFFNVTANEVEKALEVLPTYLDEPFSDTSVIPTYIISKLAKKYVTVVLSGDGGDESFAGYDWYTHYYLIQKYNRLPKVLNATISKTASALSMIKGSEFFHKVQFVSQKYGLSGYKLFAEMKKVFPLKYGEHYFKPYFKDNNINDLTRADMHIFLPFSILKKVDMCSMANSLEVRCPYLNVNLFEFSTTLPPSFKFKFGKTKYILKKALEKRLPKQIIYRKKKGFSTPLKHYFRDELKTYVLDTLSEGRISKITKFTQKDISNLIEKHIKKRETNTGRIFTLLQLELFLKNLEKRGFEFA